MIGETYVIQNGEVFREEPGGTYTPIGKVKTVPLQRGRVLAVPLPEERKRRELDLAELMAGTIEDILTEKTIGWEAAAKLVKAIEYTYPELLNMSL